MKSAIEIENIKDPLISVIITTYNHVKYLADAIASAFRQTYSNLEVIVVDDGSTDDTPLLMTNYPEVKYIRQENKGLSSARNTGIANSKGSYLVFLDADDVLYPNALRTNLKYFKGHPDCGFVSGWYDRINENKELKVIYDTPPPDKDHFLTLLKNNYIGMHATVMYQRKVFDHFHYDESLLACEDHDLYLKVAKNYPVFSHSEKIAAYRFHDHNMSHKINLMLPQALKILRKNRDDTYDPRARAFYLQGKKYYRRYYAGIVLKKLNVVNTSFEPKITFYEVKLLIAVSLKQLLKHCILVTLSRIKKIVKKILPFKHRIARLTGQTTYIPAIGRINMGDLRRTKPFSKSFGYDRGGPIDRIFIENFLHENAAYIHGRVLEIGDSFYTKAYGESRVTKSDILFVNDSNKEATIIGDLSHAGHIAEEQFDCIILTQTLHLIYDFKSALKHCYRILKKEGSLLMTVPGITPLDHGEWKDTWYWSFTGASICKLLNEYFNPFNVQVQTHGNVLTATAFLYGMGKNELKQRELEQNDPHYPVIIAARAIKT